MSSIIWNGDTYHGISVFGLGVFNDDDEYWTYAGQHKEGYACGLAVATTYNGDKVYAEYGPDGQFDGRCVDRSADGYTDYGLYERGEEKDRARLFDDGRCTYNGEDCEPTDPRLLALIAQVAPVEVRSAAPAPHPTIAFDSLPGHRPIGKPARFSPAGACEGHGHRGAFPRRTPSLMGV